MASIATSAWQNILRVLRRPSYGVLGSTDNLARWKNLKTDAASMLSPKVYQELYLLARDLPDRDIIEIGGAAGAGSIALALGLKESGKRSGIIVVEKLEGGSRLDNGDRTDNQRIIEGNFRKFGALDQVRFFPHEVTLENGHEVKALVRSGKIAAMVHDADGRVDRDFFLFWPLLDDGGSIVIDDYVDAPQKYKPVTPRNPQGGIKSVMTYRLANRMIQWGLIQVTRQIGNTLFGVKPAGADFARFDQSVCDRIIAGVKCERDAALASRSAS